MSRLIATLRLLVLCLVLGAAAPAMAQTTPTTPAPEKVLCSPTSADPATRCNTFLDGVMQYYQDAAVQATANIMPLARHAFWTLFAIELVIMSLAWVLVAAEGGGGFLMNTLVRRLGVILLFFLLMENASYFAGVILQTFTYVGVVAGTGMSSVSGPVSPSSIMGYGLGMAWTVIERIKDIPVEASFSWGDAGMNVGAGMSNLLGSVGDTAKSFLMASVYALLSLIAAFIVAAAMIITSIELLMTQVQGYIALGLAPFMFALSSFNRTAHLAENAWKMLLSFGVKVMTMVFISGIGLTVIDQAQQNWVSSAQSAGVSLTQFFSGMLLFTAVVVVFAVLVKKIPDLVQDMMNGAVNTQMGGAVISGAARVAGGAAMVAAPLAPLAGGVAGAAVGGLAGAFSATGAAIRELARGGGDTGPRAPAPSAPGAATGSAGGSATVAAAGSAGAPARVADSSSTGTAEDAPVAAPAASSAAAGGRSVGTAAVAAGPAVAAPAAAGTSAGNAGRVEVGTTSGAGSQGIPSVSAGPSVTGVRAAANEAAAEPAPAAAPASASGLRASANKAFGAAKNVMGAAASGWRDGAAAGASKGWAVGATAGRDMVQEGWETAKSGSFATAPANAVENLVKRLAPEPASDSQVGQAQKLSAATGTAIPASAYASQQAMSQFIREQASAANPANQAPTAGQLQLAQALAADSGRQVPPSAMTSRQAMSDYLQEAQLSRQANQISQGNQAPVEAPSASMIKLASALSKTTGTPVPADALQSKAALSNFIKDAQMSRQADQLMEHKPLTQPAAPTKS